MNLSYADAVVQMSDALRQLIVQGQEEGTIKRGNPNELVVLYLSALQGLAASIHLFGTVIDNFPDVNLVFGILRQ